MLETKFLILEVTVEEKFLENASVFWYRLQLWVRSLIVLSGLVVGVILWLVVMTPFSPFVLFIFLGTTNTAITLKILTIVIIVISILITLIFIPWLWFRILFRVIKSLIIMNNGGNLAGIIFKKEE